MVYWMKLTHHYISGVSQINIQLAVSSRVCLAFWMLNFFVYFKNTKKISIIYILHRKWNFSNHIDNVWWVQNYSTHILKIKFQIIYYSVDERVMKGMAIHTWSVQKSFTIGLKSTWTHRNLRYFLFQISYVLCPSIYLALYQL